MHYANQTTTAATRRAEAGVLQLTDSIRAGFCGTRTAFSREGYNSGLFKELPGEAELILSFSADQFFSRRREIRACF